MNDVEFSIDKIKELVPCFIKQFAFKMGKLGRAAVLNERAALFEFLATATATGAGLVLPDFFGTMNDGFFRWFFGQDLKYFFWCMPFIFPYAGVVFGKYKQVEETFPLLFAAEQQIVLFYNGAEFIDIKTMCDVAFDFLS